MASSPDIGASLPKRFLVGSPYKEITCVTRVPSKGRALKALKRVKKGQVLLTAGSSSSQATPGQHGSAPTIAVLLDDKVMAGTHCGVCLGDSHWGATDLQKCTKCQQIYICKNCKYSHNEIECKAYNRLYSPPVIDIFKKDDASTVLLRQLIRVLSSDNYDTILNSISILEHHYDKETRENKEKFKRNSFEALRLAFLSRKLCKDSDKTALLQRLVKTSARFAANEILISMPWRWRSSSIFNLGTEAIGIGLFVDASFVSAIHMLYNHTEYALTLILLSITLIVDGQSKRRTIHVHQMHIIHLREDQPSSCVRSAI